MMKFVYGLTGLVFSALVVFAATDAKAQSGFPVYTDNLVNGFQDWSFNSTRNFSNPTPTNSGSHSISVTITSGFGALDLEQPSDFNTTLYSSISFWINGGAVGGQRLQIFIRLDHNVQSVTFALPKLQTNVWQQVIIPLSAIGAAGITNFTGFGIQSTISSSQPVFYVDDVQLTAAPAPTIVHLKVDAGQTLRNVDARHFGVNTATWDGNLDTSSTSNVLQEMGVLALRFPGGSTADQYHWVNSKVNNTLEPTKFSNFIHVATNMGAQAFITVNYGSGTSNEAAAWVLSANVTNHCGFKYWEIGNECYGTWEMDNNNPAHDPFTYANIASGYVQLMKAADPTIKIGVVIVTGENNFSNNATHFAINPRTGTKNFGWTPIMLTTLKNLGVTPDFAIYHFYPQSTPTNWAPNSTESDPLLLQAAVNWKSDAADLRQQITDYFGPTGTNIELVCTENNSDSGAMGRQSTSIVNALYLADSKSQIMKTEFNSYIWWDLHNGPDTHGIFDPTLYGWRNNGDFGLLDGSNDRYPIFFAEKLLQYFARPGDSVLAASSDYLLLSAYAIRRSNGALTMLVINKDSTTNFNAQISLTNFAPWANATIRSYGIPQDEAARTNGSLSLQDIALTNFPVAGTNFSYAFAPYSLTLFTFAPAASGLSAFMLQSKQVMLQLQGQPNTPYVIQASSDLVNWTSVSTNTLTGTTLNITNDIPDNSSQQFWRAVWQP